MLDTLKNERTNGIDLKALGELVDGIQKDRSEAKVAFNATSRRAAQTRSKTVIEAHPKFPSLLGEREEGDEIFEALLVAAAAQYVAQTRIW